MRGVSRKGAVPLGRVPRPRAPGAVPKGHATAHAPVRPVARPPKARPVGKAPNPRRPRLVKEVHGNELKDMFAIFKDLPRPARPAPRLPPPAHRGPPRRR